MGKIYTKTGDKGKTSLFDGTRVSKTAIRVAAYGTVDELNSAIGVAASHMHKRSLLPLKRELEAMQHDLLSIGSGLATPHPLPIVGLEARTKDLEKLIDTYTAQLPPLTQFILPGGTVAAASLHMARTICRRTERGITAIAEPIDEHIRSYMNRLSDALFTMARFANYKEKKNDIIWKKK